MESNFLNGFTAHTKRNLNSFLVEQLGGRDDDVVVRGKKIKVEANSEEFFFKQNLMRLRFSIANVHPILLTKIPLRQLLPSSTLHLVQA
jgi:hypothetical protein